jgi:di/tricarboxylate transporter
MKRLIWRIVILTVMAELGLALGISLIKKGFPSVAQILIWGVLALVFTSAGTIIRNNRKSKLSSGE